MYQRLNEVAHQRGQSVNLSVYRLAKEAGRNYSNVHADIARLAELELVDKDDKGRVFVPWEDIEIHALLSAPAKKVA